MEEASETQDSARRELSASALGGFILASVALAAAVAAGLGHRSGLWSFEAGIAIAVGAVIMAVLAAILSGRGLWRILRSRGGLRGMPTALFGLVVAGGLVSYAGFWTLQARISADIADISTDPLEPPGFEVAPILREMAGTDTVERLDLADASLQYAAYPDIRPLWVSEPRQEAYVQALKTARDMGWVIVAADETAGRIEAVGATLWFGLRADYLVRVSPSGPGARIDVRGLARTRDAAAFGVNVRYVRAFLRRLENRLEGVAAAPGRVAQRRGPEQS